MTSPDVDLLWAELEQLAWSPERRGVVGDGLAVSDHAVLRYRERVERIPRVRARRRVQELAAEAVWEYQPRDWMTVVLHPNTVYGYPPRRLDVCLLERDGFVVTVLSERFLRQQQSRTARHYSDGRPFF
jgi:hypothetical protein